MYALPKKKTRTEASLDTDVNAWFVKHWPRSYALEVKVKGNKALPHQEIALRQVAKGKFSYKIPDMGRRNPFDYVGLIGADSILCTVDGKQVTCVVNEVSEVSFTLKKSTT